MASLVLVLAVGWAILNERPEALALLGVDFILTGVIVSQRIKS